MQTITEEAPPVGPQVIFAVDADCTCTLSIGPGLAALGVEPGQLVGLNLFDVYGDDPHARESLRRALAGEQFSDETPFHGRVLSVFYQPLLGPDGEVTGAIGVSTDVTEQRRVEAEVRAARERATLLADLSAVLNREVLDLHGLLRQVARSAATGLGDACLVWLFRPDPPTLEPWAGWGLSDEQLDAWRSQPPDTVGEDTYLFERGAQVEPRIVDLVAERVGEGAHGELAARIAAEGKLHSDLRVPLRSRGVLVGVLDILRGGPSPAYTEEDVSLALEVAERCALAIDNAQLLAAQRAAREDLVKFKALADASSDLIAITDVEGAAVYVNPRVFETGIVPVQENMWQTLTDWLGAGAVQEIQAALKGQMGWTGDIRITDPDLVLRLELFTLTHPETGELLGMAGIAEDVTELRITEHALREAVIDLKRFKALVEASPDFISIAELDGAVRYVNPQGRAMVGLDESLDVGATSLTDYLTTEGLAAWLETEQPEVLGHGHWEGESTLRDWKGGPPVPVAIASFLMRDAETGESIGLATVQRDITERLAAETALRQLADQRQALLTRLVDAQDAERKRIAADVHDDPVQALAAVDLRLGLLRRRIREQAPTLLASLDSLQDAVSGATDRLRALLFDLEPPNLEHGLGEAIRRCAEDVLEGSGVRWEVDATAEPDSHDSTRAVAYRIVREALINVRKHAEAEHVRILVDSRDDGMLVTVTDDGVGLEVPAESQPGHRGVTTMADRAAAAGGTCTVLRAEPHGTAVTVWLPLT